MKRFEIITEADARLLDVGETVALAQGRACDTAGGRHAEGAPGDSRRPRTRSIGRTKGSHPSPTSGVLPSAATTAGCR